MGPKGRISQLCAVAAVAAVVFSGAAAFACTNLATLGTSSSGDKAGSAVSVTGSSFAAPEQGAAPSPVSIRWNKVDGPVLATLVPDANGAISGSFTPLETTPGHYVVIATQVDDEGKPQFGTPARVPFEVLGPSGESVAPSAPRTAVTSSSSSDSSSLVPLALVAVLGVVSLGVFGAGLASFQKTRSGRGRPEVVPAPEPGSRPEREPAHRI